MGQQLLGGARLQDVDAAPHLGIPGRLLSFSWANVEESLKGDRDVAQRVQLECHYGSRAPKTIYGMVFGT